MQTPTIGRIVLLRNDDSIDVPAIITSVIGDVDRVPAAMTPGGDRVHLHQFVPPNARGVFTHPDYGVPYSEEPQPGTWRWPERVPAAKETAK